LARRSRHLAEVYVKSRLEALALQRRLGGQIRPVKPAAYLAQKPSAPLRIGGKFEIVHENTSACRRRPPPRLFIPHGMAFGSGEHVTTAMLLHALARRSLTDCRVLDLGAGSGILALAARLLGARKITGTDIDPQAVRTARQNEKLNFRSPLIRWLCADLRHWRGPSQYDIVLANLFSAVLVDAAPGIAGAVTPGGALWMSGILRHQVLEVTKAYRKQRLVLLRSAMRGKWVLLQWQKQRIAPETAKKNFSMKWTQ